MAVSGRSHPKSRHANDQLSAAAVEATPRVKPRDAPHVTRPLVRRVADRMIAKLPTNVERDDLIQVGLIGLSDALARFDTAHRVRI